jgi:hypothetical protein
MVHFAMLKGIATNVTAVPESLIRERVELAIQGELLTDGVDHEASCPCLRDRYRSARLVSVVHLDGEAIPDSESC